MYICENRNKLNAHQESVSLCGYNYLSTQKSNGNNRVIDITYVLFFVTYVLLRVHIYLEMRLEGFLQCSNDLSVVGRIVGDLHFLFFFWPCSSACRILVSRPGALGSGSAEP